ncbi:MAG: TonB-dependent receptor plug domain-containing protein, partial [Prevotella sp.]|nr:TonB-dependent receptor plug domain-containing protein [Prevotella sp.]
MKKFAMMSLLALMWICWVPQQSAAETRKLYGYVTDVNNEPLVGVSVRVYRTSYVTVTDAKGRYQLGGDWARGATILFTYIGYKPQKLQDDGRERMDVKMEEAATGIGEVVVKAKSNINAIDLRSKAGIVENVDIKRLNEKPMIDLGLALQGMIPGLNVINQGELGTAPQIRIRGNSSFRRGNVSNEPLYVLDGKIISAETFYNLNPQDIASIKVLKDAAAGALYGIKAANGVLEISSQHGYQG